MQIKSFYDCYIAVGCFVRILKITSGVLWKTYLDLTFHDCQDKWWTFLFYGQNIIKRDIVYVTLGISFFIKTNTKKSILFFQVLSSFVVHCGWYATIYRISCDAYPLWKCGRSQNWFDHLEKLFCSLSSTHGRNCWLQPISSIVVFVWF